MVPFEGFHKNFEKKIIKKNFFPPRKGALKCSFFAVAALVGAGLLSCCLLRQPASFTAQPTNEQFQDPLADFLACVPPALQGPSRYVIFDYIFIICMTNGGKNVY